MVGFAISSCNGWSKEGSRYMMCKTRGLGLGQGPGLGEKSKVLELPQQKLSTRRTRGNQSIKKSIQEVA
jgi:hypothetical protein